MGQRGEGTKRRLDKRRRADCYWEWVGAADILSPFLALICFSGFMQTCTNDAASAGLSEDVQAYPGARE